MFSPFLQRYLCGQRQLFQYTSRRQQACLSTTAAIKRGLWHTQIGREKKKGGRDGTGSIPSFPRASPSTRFPHSRPSDQDRRKASSHFQLPRDRGSSGSNHRAGREKPRPDTFSSRTPPSTDVAPFRERRSFGGRPDSGDKRASWGGRGNQKKDRDAMVSRNAPPAQEYPFQDRRRPDWDRSNLQQPMERWGSRDRPNREYGREPPRTFKEPRSASRPSRYETSRPSSRYENSRSSSRYEGRGSVPADGIDEGSPQGLLKSIKDVSRCIHFIQQKQSTGDDVEELLRDAKHALKVVNSHITTGTFKESDPAEAVVSLFHKKARTGTFLAGDIPDGKKSVIYVTRDGLIDISIGKPPVDPSASKERRIDREQRLWKPEDRRRPDREATRDAYATTSSRFEEEEDDNVPVSIPYTTAASQFLYGYNAVLAALKARKRKLHKLYLHSGIFEREAGYSGTSSGEKPADELLALAKKAGIPVRTESKTFMLNKMSNGRAHNGVVLEASRLPSPPVLSLGKPEHMKGLIPLTLAPQSAEDAEVNGTPTNINGLRSTWRHPLIVLLDGITDPGNVGGIIRSCHFYGVDAVAIATNTCANLSSAVLAKASSGACEAMHLLSLPRPSDFVHDSSKYRWRVYAAVAPPSGGFDFAHKLITTGAIAGSSPLTKHPCILMLGAEGEGLRDSLRNRADRYVCIERGQKPEDAPVVSVDSMNVGVAAGVLLEAFMRKPADAPAQVSEELGF